MSLDLRQLEGFNAKDFELVVQSWANSTNVLPPELHQAYLHRLAENRVSLPCLHTVIFDAYELGWRPVQLATVKYLQDRHEVAVKVLALHSQNKANSTPRYESSRTGPEDNLTFTTEVVLDIGGTLYHGWATGTQSKAVKQAAVACLLAAVVGFRTEDYDEARLHGTGE